MATPQQRRPTLRDVADRAGVSFKTVSRVVNDERGVSDNVVGRVQTAITALGYRPDDRARTLRQGGSRTGLIGFVLVDVANPFFSSILRGIEEVAREHEYLVLSGSTDGEPRREAQLIEAFVDRRVDGLIVVSSDVGSGTLRAEADRGSPVVFLDLEPNPLSGDLVRSDHFGGAVLATEHLIRHGHRDITLFSDDPSVFSAGQRVDGFCDAMARHGLDIRSHRIVRGRHTVNDWHQIIRNCLIAPDRPTALFTAQNLITVGAVRALHELDLHTLIALVGFDEVEMADVVQPGISVVPQYPLDLGRRAAKRLFARIGGLDEPPMRDVIVSSVIERGSGEIPPYRDGGGGQNLGSSTRQTHSSV